MKRVMRLSYIFKSRNISPFLRVPRGISHRSLSQASKLTYSIQDDYMHNDQCFVVDENDHVKYTASKKQRSKSKITFPFQWTNTCCSHPCANYSGEEDESDAIGVRRAALRKVEHELGIIPERTLNLEDIHMLAKFLYYAPNEPADCLWSEREIDYILIGILPDASAFLKPNPDEVAATKWSDLSTLLSSIASNPDLYTPWFRKLGQEQYLAKMWDWAESKAAKSEHFSLIDSCWDRSLIHRLE